MKEITAIIRMNKIQPTKAALLAEGYPSFTVQKAMGRGKQKGLKYEFSPPLKDLGDPAARSSRIEFIPKRYLTLLVEDKCVEKVIGILASTNKSGHPGDGKIFVSPVSEVIRIRTAEKGDMALL